MIRIWEDNLPESVTLPLPNHFTASIFTIAGPQNLVGRPFLNLVVTLNRPTAGF